MRRVLALLLMTFALASPAGAAGPVKQPAPKKAPVAAPVTTPSAVLQAPIPLASTTPGGDAGQCRASCAKTYYFCSARDDGECPTQWAQCNARCVSTYKR